MSAGRDSTWRRTARAEDEEDGGGAGGGGMEVVPLELYDCARSKIEANLRWLFAKAYGIGKDLSSLCSSLHTLLSNYLIRHFSLDVYRKRKENMFASLYVPGAPIKHV